MNFVVASFLYHSGPEVTLVLATSLIEDYEMCDVYKDNLDGLHYHNSVIDKMMSVRKEKLYGHIMINGVLTEMFTTSWVLDLFSHVIPLDIYVSVFEFNFLRRISMIISLLRSGIMCTSLSYRF
jgi:hypothetical protein